MTPVIARLRAAWRAFVTPSPAAGEIAITIDEGPRRMVSIVIYRWDLPLGPRIIFSDISPLPAGGGYSWAAGGPSFGPLPIRNIERIRVASLLRSPA